MLANEPCCIHCSHGGFPDTHTRPCDRCALAPTSEWEPLYRAEKRRADAAEAAVARVRALHVETHDGSCSDPEHCTPVNESGYLCGECYDDWPCPTITALDVP